MLFGSKLSKVEAWAKKGKFDKLIEALSDRDEAVQTAAIKGLSSIKNDDVVNNLISYMRNPNPVIRGHIIEALGNIGDSRAMEHIRHLANADEDASVREKAAEALKVLTK